MRTGLYRSTLFLAVLIAGFVGASATAALGSRAGSSPIDQAAAKSAAASSVKFDFTIAITGGGTGLPGGKIALSGMGAVDSKHKSADFKLDLGSLAPLLAAAAKGAQVPKSIELLVVDNVLYLHFPALAQRLGARGKEWVKLDPSALPKSKTGGINPNAVGAITPQHALGVLRAALNISKIGADQYGTHYHATVDLAAIVALVPKAQRASTRSGLTKAGLKTIPIDIWVGKLGYLSRFATSLTVKTRPGAPAIKLSLALNLHDYGATINLSAPPAAKTADGTKLIAGLLPGIPTGG